MCLWKPALGALVTTALMATSLVREHVAEAAHAASCGWPRWPYSSGRSSSADTAVSSRPTSASSRVEGVVNRRRAVMRRGKVTDMELNRSTPGEDLQLRDDQDRERRAGPATEPDRLRPLPSGDLPVASMPSSRSRSGSTRTRPRAAPAAPSSRARRAAAKVRGEVPLQTSLARETSARHIPAADFDHGG